VKGKLRIKKTGDGKLFVVKTMKLTDEAGARKIKEKKSEIAAKKRTKKETGD